METIHYIYNDVEVDFMPGGNDTVMVNATQMAKIFGKDLFQFTKSESAKTFIKTCLKPANAGLLGIQNEEDLIISKQKSGTWMHRILALKFAAWLDPDFEVWVFLTIDTILLGMYREQKEATAEKLRAEQALELKKRELLQKFPEFQEFLELEGRVSEAEKRRIKSIKESIKQLKFDLFC